MKRVTDYLSMILYKHDLPGQVESIIQQLSSVDHWNKLEKTRAISLSLPLKTTQIKKEGKDHGLL